MATMLRRPFVLANGFKHFAKSPTSSIRALNTSPRTTALKTASPLTNISFTGTRTLSTFRNAFHRRATTPLQTLARRAYTNNAVPNLGVNSGELRNRLLYGGLLFGGTLLAINIVFNRETREDGGMPPFERAYLNDTFLHTGLGLGIIAVASRALHTSGWSIRLMSSNPWLVLGVGLAGSIGTMIGCRATHPDNYIQKYALWGAFNVTQAALLSPLMFMQPALLARAGLYTVAMMGSLAWVGATAKQEKYLYLGGPLLAGVAIVAVSGLAPLVLPVTAVRTLAVTENLWLYGGLAVFGGFTLYDVQKVLAHARMAEQGMLAKDPVNESIGLELDFINIFIRMVQILGMQQRRK